MRKFIILTFLLFIFVTKSLSQDFAPSKEHAFFYTPKNVGFATPQSSDFIRYGNLDIDHYNGLLNMTIPLEGYSDNDFEIPISLRYISDGFKPSKRPSLVGYNWLLDVGGIITRDVYGAPDDVKGNISNNRLLHMPQGCLVGDRARGSSPSNNDLWNISTDGIDYHKGDFDNDIFHFNFGKHKGRFIIKDAQAVLLDEKGYRIDITGMTSQNFTYTNAPSTSKIVIYTPDGFKYEFGGTTSFLEYFIPNNPDRVKKRPVHIISWYLNKITAPNNRTVIFTYSSVEQKNKYEYFIRNIVSQVIYIDKTSPGRSETRWGPNLEENKAIEIIDKVFVPFLDNIQIGSATINFTRNKYNLSFYSTETTSDLYRLTEISYKYNSKEIKKETLSYTQKNRYFFLSSLSSNSHAGNDQIYKFEYNFKKDLPDPQTISTDHWGYWNGNYDTSENVTTYLNNITSRKAVNTTVCDIGLLKKVIYPTKGSTEITYEHNRYHHYRKRNMQSIMLDANISSTAKVCGGARVKSIKDYDPVGGGSYNIKTFQYKRPKTTQESGTISLVPEYKSSDRIQGQSMYSEIIWDNGQAINIICRAMLTRDYLTISSNTISRNNNTEYPIGYSDVVETLNDGSYIHYNFHSWIDVPDDVDSNHSYSELNVGWDGYIISSRLLTGPAYLEKFGLYKTNDMSKFRGKLIQKSIYSYSGDLVEREVYTYNKSTASDSYIVSVTCEPGGLAANKIFLTPCNIEKKEVIKSGVSNTILYTYNGNNFISQINYTDSHNRKFKKNIKYVSDYVMTGTNANYRKTIKEMINKNMINYIAEEQNQRYENGQWGIFEGKLVTYGNFSNQYNPKTEYALYANGTLINASFSELSSIGDLNIHSAYAKEREYYNYDTYANPVYMSINGADSVIYLWSYQGRYPIAEIQNATYDQVKAVLNETAITRLTTDPVPSEADLTALKNLRTSTNANLKKAFVTVYEYKPLVGISKQTDPRGIVTLYDYDAFGRLSKVTYDGKIIEEYNYNYRNQ